MLQDIATPTIAALATPPGSGGIGIIRISGSGALPILKKLFRPRKNDCSYSSHTLHYGWITNPATRMPLDEVLAVYMKAPHTYTREDIAEIHCHGSFLVLQNILSQVLILGARLAEPGEFTKRAFLNGRIDLTQAEAVMDVLQAKTQAGLSLAMGQLEGELFQQLKKIQDALIDIRAILEVALDFPDEDVEILDSSTLAAKCRKQAIEPLQDLLSASVRGKIYREGIAAVLLGRPNVGKSSLLNALLQEERAIVTAVPGTTRDTIEEYLDIKGIPVRIIDTAGIREPGETVEAAGIHRAREKMDTADLIILIFDASELPTTEDRELFKVVQDRKTILIANKKDIADENTLNLYREAFPGPPLIAVSALYRHGINAIEETLFATVTGGKEGLQEPDHTCTPNIRHQADLKKALAECEKALQGMEDKLPPDLLAVDIQSALDYLGDITGHTTAEDILDRIFNQFCIGK